MTAPLSAPGTPAPARKSLSAPSSPASCEIEIVAVPAPARKSLSAPSSPASCEIEIGAIQGPHSAPPRFASLFLPAAVAFPSASSIASSYFMLKFETPKYYCTVIDASTTGGFEAISEADCVVFIIDSTTGGFDAGISKDGQTLEDYLLAPLGLMQLICCRNKMDATTPKYSKANDDDVVKEVSSFLKKVGYSPDNFHFVPISGFEGAEVAMKDLKRRSVSPPTSLSGISSGPTSSSKSHFKPIPQSFLSFDYRRDSAKPWLTQHGNQEAKYSTLSSGKPLPHIERWKNVRPKTTKKSFHLKTRAEDKQSPDSVSRHRSSAREDSLKKVQMRRSLVERMSALDEE